MQNKNDAEKLAAREKNIDERLQELNARHGRNKPETVENASSSSAGYGNAFRLSSEFVSAILVGAAIGYGIDWLAGTLPWGMILFLLLGFVAGVLNVLRAAGELSSDGYKTTGSEQSEEEH